MSAQDIIDALLSMEAIRIYFIIFCVLIIAIAASTMIAGTRRKKTTVIEKKIVDETFETQEGTSHVSNYHAVGTGTTYTTNNGFPVAKSSASEALKPGESRFPTLAMIDETHPNLERVKCDPGLTLESICYNFKMFAAGDLHLYYSDQDIRSFVSSLACSKILLLQGMSGTGKTSLPVAFGKFISNPTAVVPVQPTWKE